MKLRLPQPSLKSKPGQERSARWGLLTPQYHTIRIMVIPSYPFAKNATSSIQKHTAWQGGWPNQKSKLTTMETSSKAMQQPSLALLEMAWLSRRLQMDRLQNAASFQSYCQGKQRYKTSLRSSSSIANASCSSSTCHDEVCDWGGHNLKLFWAQGSRQVLLGPFIGLHPWIKLRRVEEIWNLCLQSWSADYCQSRHAVKKLDAPLTA